MTERKTAGDRAKDFVLLGKKNEVKRSRCARGEGEIDGGGSLRVEELGERCILGLMKMPHVTVLKDNHHEITTEE